MSKTKVRTSRISGFTLVEIMIFVAIIGLLAAIAIPNFIRARTTAQKNACINNLRQIDGAIQQWALENKKRSDAHTSVIQLPDYLICRLLLATNRTVFSDSYTINTVADKPVCQI